MASAVLPGHEFRWNELTRGSLPLCSFSPVGPNSSLGAWVLKETPGILQKVKPIAWRRRYLLYEPESPFLCYFEGSHATAKCLGAVYLHAAKIDFPKGMRHPYVIRIVMAVPRRAPLRNTSGADAPWTWQQKISHYWDSKRVRTETFVFAFKGKDFVVWKDLLDKACQQDYSYVSPRGILMMSDTSPYRETQTQMSFGGGRRASYDASSHHLEAPSPVSQASPSHEMMPDSPRSLMHNESFSRGPQPLSGGRRPMEISPPPVENSDEVASINETMERLMWQAKQQILDMQSEIEKAEVHVKTPVYTVYIPPQPTKVVEAKASMKAFQAVNQDDIMLASHFNELCDRVDVQQATLSRLRENLYSVQIGGMPSPSQDRRSMMVQVPIHHEVGGGLQSPPPPRFTGGGDGMGLGMITSDVPQPASPPLVPLSPAAGAVDMYYENLLREREDKLTKDIVTRTTENTKRKARIESKRRQVDELLFGGSVINGPTPLLSPEGGMYYNDPRDHYESSRAGSPVLSEFSV